MQTVTDLIDAARKALNVNSDAEFARQLGVSRGTIANWKSGYSLPDTVMCATLAGLTGLPLARVLGIVGEARAVSREEKAVWRKLAATAMALCLAVGFALPHKAQAAVPGFDNAHVVYIMRNSASAGCRRLWAPLGSRAGSGLALADGTTKSVLLRQVNLYSSARLRAAGLPGRDETDRRRAVPPGVARTRSRHRPDHPAPRRAGRLGRGTSAGTACAQASSPKVRVKASPCPP